MKNPRITPKERNLIKGAIRRVFSRSELRKSAVDKSLAPKHTDGTRPRVKTWCICPECMVFTPKSYMQVDHVSPIIALDSSLEDMSWDDLVDNIWCDPNNLLAICENCHTIKTKAEAKQRAANKKKRKHNE